MKKTIFSNNPSMIIGKYIGIMNGNEASKNVLF